MYMKLINTKIIFCKFPETSSYFLKTLKTNAKIFHKTSDFSVEI